MKIEVKRLNHLLSLLYQEMILLNDTDRDLPVRWNVMHMFTSTQLAKLIAVKRNLDIELSGIIAALHDIAVWKTGKRRNHAENATVYIEELINKYNEARINLPEITVIEKKIIIAAVISHSNKEVISENPYGELLKDVDSLDRLLHGIDTEDAYLARCYKVMQEFNLNRVN